jgi:hypothetical protein
MKIPTDWDVTHCSPVVHRRFGVKYYLHLQSPRVNYANNQQYSTNKAITGCSLGLHLYLKVEAVYSSETSINFYHISRRHVGETLLMASGVRRPVLITTRWIFGSHWNTHSQLIQIIRMYFIFFKWLLYIIWDSLVGLRTDGLGFYSRQGQNMILYTIASRPPLQPTQSPILWALAAISTGLKWPGREANHSPPSSGDVNSDGAIPPLPTRLHGVVLN